MPIIDVHLQCPILDSFRVRQVAGMFDLPLAQRAEERFRVDLPDLSEPWRIGAIVGPSGSGKTTVARAAFGQNLYRPAPWRSDLAVIDGLGDLPIRTLTQTLSAVGFASPRSWLKPYGVLSNGEKFRCDLARAMLSPDLVVFDEFTSFVDRTAARIGSAAVSRAIRSGKIGARFVTVTCHYDIIPWLAPDWVLDMADGSLTRGLLRRPKLKLRVRRARAEEWSIFRRHHYLSGALHRSAQCFAGEVEGKPAAFCAVLPFPHPKRPGYREHRIVCLPDFQGVGIGHALGEFVASLYAAKGKPYFSVSGHPGIIRHRSASPLWRMLRSPRLMRPVSASGAGKTGMSGTCSTNRLTASFEYVGPSNRLESKRLHILWHL